MSSDFIYFSLPITSRERIVADTAIITQNSTDACEHISEHFITAIVRSLTRLTALHPVVTGALKLHRSKQAAVHPTLIAKLHRSLQSIVVRRQRTSVYYLDPPSSSAHSPIFEP